LLLWTLSYCWSCVIKPSFSKDNQQVHITLLNLHTQGIMNKENTNSDLLQCFIAKSQHYFTNICIRVSLVMVTICPPNTLRNFSKCFINVYNCGYLVLHHLVGSWHYIKYCPFYGFLISFGLGICYLDWKTNCVLENFFQMIYDKFDSFTMGKVVRMDNAKVMIQMDQHIPRIAILLTFISFIYYKFLFMDFLKIMLLTNI
jgi:hypothetical protein